MYVFKKIKKKKKKNKQQILLNSTFLKINTRKNSVLLNHFKMSKAVDLENIRSRSLFQ